MKPSTRSSRRSIPPANRATPVPSARQRATPATRRQRSSSRAEEITPTPSRQTVPSHDVADESVRNQTMNLSHAKGVFVSSTALSNVIIGAPFIANSSTTGATGTGVQTAKLATNQPIRFIGPNGVNIKDLVPLVDTNGQPVFASYIPDLEFLSGEGAAKWILRVLGPEQAKRLSTLTVKEQHREILRITNSSTSNSMKEAIFQANIASGFPSIIRVLTGAEAQMLQNKMIEPFGPSWKIYAFDRLNRRSLQDADEELPRTLAEMQNPRIKEEEEEEEEEDGEEEEEEEEIQKEECDVSKGEMQHPPQFASLTPGPSNIRRILTMTAEEIQAFRQSTPHSNSTQVIPVRGEPADEMPSLVREHQTDEHREETEKADNQAGTSGRQHNSSIGKRKSTAELPETSKMAKTSGGQFSSTNVAGTSITSDESKTQAAASSLGGTSSEREQREVRHYVAMMLTETPSSAAPPAQLVSTVLNAPANSGATMSAATSAVLPINSIANSTSSTRKPPIIVTQSGHRNSALNRQVANHLTNFSQQTSSQNRAVPVVSVSQASLPVSQYGARSVSQLLMKSSPQQHPRAAHQDAPRAPSQIQQSQSQSQNEQPPQRPVTHDRPRISPPQLTQQVPQRPAPQNSAPIPAHHQLQMQQQAQRPSQHANIDVVVAQIIAQRNAAASQPNNNNQPVILPVINRMMSQPQQRRGSGGSRNFRSNQIPMNPPPVMPERPRLMDQRDGRVFIPPNRTLDHEKWTEDDVAEWASMFLVNNPERTVEKLRAECITGDLIHHVITTPQARVELQIPLGHYQKLRDHGAALINARAEQMYNEAMRNYELRCQEWRLQQRR